MNRFILRKVFNGAFKNFTPRGLFLEDSFKVSDILAAVHATVAEDQRHPVPGELCVVRWLSQHNFIIVITYICNLSRLINSLPRTIIYFFETCLRAS